MKKDEKKLTLKKDPESMKQFEHRSNEKNKYKCKLVNDPKVKNWEFLLSFYILLEAAVSSKVFKLVYLAI